MLKIAKKKIYMKSNVLALLSYVCYSFRVLINYIVCCFTEKETEVIS